MSATTGIQWTEAALRARTAWALEQVALHSIPEPNTGCLLWTTRGESRYPFLEYRGRRTLISRALLGLTDRWVFACHTCDTPACVNSAHLFVGDAKANAADMAAKGRVRSQRKTHCPRGHKYTPDNLLSKKLKVRACKSCKREKDRASRLLAVSATDAVLVRVKLVEEATTLERIGGDWSVQHVLAVLSCHKATLYRNHWLMSRSLRLPRATAFHPSDVRTYQITYSDLEARRLARREV